MLKGLKTTFGADFAALPMVNSVILRGTRRLFSFKYLFGEANIDQNYQSLEAAKISR